MKVPTLSICVTILSTLVGMAAGGPALAQVNVEAQCRGATGKAYACCVRIVTNHPRVTQCDKEVAVFRCVGNKNSKYVSRNGCVMPKL
jgi:hypothetical protein